jgi:hypothetical protein
MQHIADDAFQVRSITSDDLPWVIQDYVSDIKFCITWAQHNKWHCEEIFCNTGVANAHATHYKLSQRTG